MAIGAVFLSFQVAFFGSLYLALVRDLELLQGLAVYSALGTVTFTALLIATAFEALNARLW